MSLQVLIHEGELQQIVEVIKQQRIGSQIRGCLFGLWRNSMKQPVIQFVSCPGEDAGSESHMDCSPDDYEMRCKDILEAKHAMLKLGYWLSGSPNDYSDVIPQYLDDLKCNLLLFIKISSSEMTGHFYLKTKTEKNDSVLYKEDVLPGESSFRLSTSLTEEIAKGARYSCDPKDSSSLSRYIDSLPSRTNIEPNTNKEQWYANEKGRELLQMLFQGFKNVDIQVEMSRDGTTHNFQFTLNQNLCLDFPPDFPNRKPRVSHIDGSLLSNSLDFWFTPGDNQSISDGLVGAARELLRYY